MPPILLATANPHKLTELQAILARSNITLPSHITIQSLDYSRSPLHEPRETGRTFEENSAIKAISYAKQTNHLCLADDSGLEIDALHGRPGVISSHYSTDGQETGLPRHERDQANNRRVLQELDGIAPHRRAARFVCVMTLADPDGRILLTARGTFEGRIGLPPAVPRGHGGFGYDPLFLVAPDFTQTSAELSADEKNRLSHRAKAATELFKKLPDPLEP